MEAQFRPIAVKANQQRVGKNGCIWITMTGQKKNTGGWKDLK
jgi:hypothetical protein